MKLNRAWLIAVIAIILLFLRLGGTSVFQVAEARNSECAREMMKSADKVVPTFNGSLRTDKPALEYYAMMSAYYLFGVNEGSARFFSAVCGLLVILGTFWLVKKHVNGRAAWWSAFVLLSSMHTIIQFRLATPDPYLVLSHVLSLYCFWQGFTSRRFAWYAGMYVLLGLGLFAKGPVGLLLPAITIFLYLVFIKELTWKNIVHLQPWSGLLLMAAVCVPWYYLVHLHTDGAWTRGFFLEHNVGRFDEPVDNHGGPFIITFLFVILGMFPFSVFFIRAGKYVWRERKHNHFLLFQLVAFCVVVGFYFFSSTRLLNYTTPAYPFFAIMLGCWLAERLPVLSFTNTKPEALVVCVLTFLMPFGIYIWAVNTPPVDEVSWIAFPLLIFPVGAFIGWRYRKQVAKLWFAVGATYMLATVLVFAWLFPAMDSVSAMKKRETFLNRSENMAAYTAVNDAFVFYTPHTFQVYNAMDSLAGFIASHDSAVVFYNGKDFAPLDSLPSLRLYSKDRDLFSTKYSAIYIKK